MVVELAMRNKGIVGLGLFILGLGEEKQTRND